MQMILYRALIGRSSANSFRRGFRKELSLLRRVLSEESPLEISSERAKLTSLQDVRLPTGRLVNLSSKRFENLETLEVSLQLLNSLPLLSGSTSYLPSS